MLLVDSSVWIDYFRNVISPETDALDKCLGAEQIVVGDIVLTEVLQGFDQDFEYRRALKFFAPFRTIAICDRSIAIKAAENYRTLRARGITVRKTIDTLIATRCIEYSLPLLYSDRDFDPFVAHLGLQDAMT